jgi:hypothetical protein
MPSRKHFENLSVADLKERLEKIWHKHEMLCRESMAECLYWLRKKMRAQGARNDQKKDKPEGFGAWCEANLHITRRTADKWADAWAIAQGLKKPSKKTPKTFRPDSKSDKGNAAGDGTVVVTYQMTLTEQENEAWLAALKALGSAAQKVIFDAVIDAARVPKKPAMSATEAGSKRMTFLDDQPDTFLAAMEQANSKGVGK